VTGCYPFYEGETTVDYFSICTVFFSTSVNTVSENRNGIRTTNLHCKAINTCIMKMKKSGSIYYIFLTPFPTNARNLVLTILENIWNLAPYSVSDKLKLHTYYTNPDTTIEG
jgi:hypothetical protein